MGLELSHPTGKLSNSVQAIWSVRGAQQPIQKKLFSDASTGILFNLAGTICIDGEALPQGIVALPVKKQTEKITLYPDTQLAGVRLLPAVGYALCSQTFDSIKNLPLALEEQLGLTQVYEALQASHDNDTRIAILYRWAHKYLAAEEKLPIALANALDSLEQGYSVGTIEQHNHLSQRQIERLFKRWLDMTPKSYQRILRFRKTLDYLRRQQAPNLAEAAQLLGFSDQAHMTRELRKLGKLTPKQLVDSRGALSN